MTLVFTGQEGSASRFLDGLSGLNVAPLIFTRLTKSILKELWLKGVQLLVYLDNWFIWAPSASECTAALDIALSVIQKRILSHQLVQVSMGDSVGSSVSAEGNKIQYSGLSLPVPLFFSCVEEGLEESHGKITICFNGRSHLQATSYRSQSVSVKSYQSQAPGQKVSSTTSSQEIFTKVFSSLSIEEKKSLDKICTFHQRTHRCLNVGMGLPYFRQNVRFGCLVSSVSETSHQYPGVGNNLHYNKLSANSMRCSHQNSLQKLNNSPLQQSGRFSEIPYSEQLNSFLNPLLRKKG